ncbi:MAG: cycloisomaltooligosaccharide glucanotransferase [Prevotella sp.]|nr:cycloisomaltooligosaccharide glucanotransferase [Prevotella sp.]
MKKMNILLFIAAFSALSCSGDNDAYNNEYSTPESFAPVVTMTDNICLEITTDKAIYAPKAQINFNISGSIPEGAKIRIRHGADVVEDQPLITNTFSWTAPSTDNMGYIVDVYTLSDNKENIYGTIGVDVSSNWKRFPRYGFVGTYDASKTSSQIEYELSFLNRCHINGLQFYDWQNKHHWPLGGNSNELLDEYKDIANRQVLTSVVKNYISGAHQLGMKAMFYNLCYGALDDAKADGVSNRWFLYKNNKHSDIDKLDLSNDWKSDIYLLDPANKDWQNYIIERNNDVYNSLDFDGFHIDQVGDRGTVYDYYGGNVNLPRSFASFIKAVKNARPEKSLVMNAVSRFGQQNIAGTNDVDFLYNEMWGTEDMFSDFGKVINENNYFSGNTMNTVFAAYMNYGKSGSQGTFNTPGILLTDAVIFALGGAHLELGDHMLCHEYFPNSNLQMSSELKKNIVAYYDFMTAYENLLRDGGQQTASDIVSGNQSICINAWPPLMHGVTAINRNVGNRQVINLINFSKANSLSWRDMNGTQPEPTAFSNIPVRIKAAGVKKVWVASPDYIGGAPQQISFKQDGDYVLTTVPNLKYWSMIVLEK